MALSCAAVRTPSAVLTTLAAAGLLCLAAGPATAATTTTKPKTTKVVLDTWETKEQAVTWQKATWQETQAYCQGLKGAYPPLVCGNSVTGKTAMKQGKKYVVTVSGLVSLFKTWPATCGTPEKLPDGTLAGTDAQFEFANNLGPTDCYLTNGGAAVWPSFVWSLTDAGVFAHPTATGKPTAPTKDHTYTFTATGHGKKPQFRWYDVQTTDNKGSLTITYRLKKAAKK